MEELRLPELGENIETADVAAVLVAPGDRVKRDQPVIEVETEKASLEVPATSDGTVTELLVAVGDKIKVGQVILRIDTGAAAEAQQPAEARQPVEAQQPAEAQRPAEPAEETAARATPPPAAAARSSPSARPSAPAAAAAATATKTEEASEPSVLAFRPAEPRARPEIGPTVPAAPSVRALARELGVDILDVKGSGPGGRISRDDVKAHTKRLIRTAGAPAAPGAAPTAALPDLSRWGEVVREPLTAVRRATARSMATSWANVPHVTQFDRADITQLESLRKRFNTRDEVRDRKLTLTAIVVKMLAAAVRQFPRFNASLDLERDEIVYRKYIHVAVAVDTDRGLLVPVIREVDSKSLLHVAAEIVELAARARDKKLAPEEMSGAGITVSNLGGLGTTYFSPIVPWPQAAILGVGRAAHEAVYVDGQFEPRLMLPLSVSYDHRLIDGADAARFLRWLAEALEQPLLLVLDE